MLMGRGRSEHWMRTRVSKCYNFADMSSALCFVVLCSCRLSTPWSYAAVSTVYCGVNTLWSVYITCGFDLYLWVWCSYRYGVTGYRYGVGDETHQEN